MNLKELFGKAQNGTLTYEQLEALMTENKTKFVDLSEGKYVDKQKYTDDIAARDTRITSLDETIKTRDNDLANLQQQLTNAGTDATKLNELTTNFSDLQKKYEKDTKAYEKQLKDQAYKFAVTEFANQQKFTSQAAKRDFVNTLLAKNLQMDGDTIIGATDFVATYTKDNADAFATDKNPEPQKPQPHFVDKTNDPSGGNPPDPNAFHFSFASVH